MSWGTVICSECKREVHQAAFTHEWRHCEDGTLRCAAASSIYPDTPSDIKGRACGQDEMTGRPRGWDVN
jgi:hypothetical protein